MEGTNKPGLVALRQRREQVIDQLTDRFAADALDMDEFELRLDRAHAATDLATLDALIEDLAPADPAPEQTALVAPEPAAAEAIELARPARRTLVAMLGGVERKGSWRVPKKTRVLAVMGGAELDFRDAQLPPGVTEVKIAAVMGGADIIVPPDLAVDCDGWAIMGGFGHMSRAPAVPDPNKPLLRITGFCLMGGFDIHTRLPGESARDARKRRRRERKALRDKRRRELEQADRKQLTE